jgi:signal transduction histidine kinase
MLHELLQLESTIAALLKQARKMFRADVAEILLLPEGTARRASLSAIRGDEEAVLLQPVRPEPSQGIWARVVLEGKAQLLAKPIRPEALRTYFAERGIKDVMIGPLLGKNATIGTVMVANRLGDVGTFDEEDLKLFETLANHASVSIENARLVADLEHSLAHLTELNRLKDDFAATVSHELRTPLTAIQGYVKTLLRRGSSFDEVEQRSFLEAIARQSDRLRRLIEDVLEVSRIESGRGQARSSRVNLLEIASSVVEEARQSALGHSFTIDIPAELPAIYTDPGKVRQILSNLVDNAVKYSARGSRVTIAATRDARAEQERVVVRVKDEGEGVPEDLRERIFERFYQVNQSSTREAGGTGLGLYVCSRLAGVVGGRVCLESSGSNGSTFCLVLPADGAPASGGRSGEVLATSGAL